MAKSVESFGHGGVLENCCTILVSSGGAALTNEMQKYNPSHLASVHKVHFHKLLSYIISTENIRALELAIKMPCDVMTVDDSDQTLVSLAVEIFTDSPSDESASILRVLLQHPSAQDIDPKKYMLVQEACQNHSDIAAINELYQLIIWNILDAELHQYIDEVLASTPRGEAQRAVAKALVSWIDEQGLDTAIISQLYTHIKAEGRGDIVETALQEYIENPVVYGLEVICEEPPEQVWLDEHLALHDGNQDTQLCYMRKLYETDDVQSDPSKVAILQEWLTEATSQANLDDLSPTNMAKLHLQLSLARVESDGGGSLLDSPLSTIGEIVEGKMPEGDDPIDLM